MRFNQSAEQHQLDREQLSNINQKLASWLSADLPAYNHLQIECIWQYTYRVKAFLLHVDGGYVNAAPTYEYLSDLETKLCGIQSWQ